MGLLFGRYRLRIRFDIFALVTNQERVIMVCVWYVLQKISDSFYELLAKMHLNTLNLMRLEEKLFFSFLVFACAPKKSELFILEKPFFMKSNPVFLQGDFFVNAVSKQILFFTIRTFFFI